MEEQIEKELLSAFACFECGSTKMQVRGIRKQFTETQEGGLLIQCAECGSLVSTVALTDESYEMIVEGEKENLQYELEELEQN